jgi:hypothetical protein
VKLIGREAEAFVFELSAQEKGLMLTLLSFFPQVPVAHHRLSQTANQPGDAANQRLLEESLMAQNAEDQEWLSTSFDGAPHFEAVEKGFHLKVKRSEMDRLLQIFNDVRVGSWLALNSPDLEQKKRLSPTRLSTPFIQRMELAGAFEMILIQALRNPEQGA